ncbi:MAG: radical SAM family heme chaperone HemW [Opitutales bacterium]|nr:radical SAM family heme chaperone HemW [Opitutales bacterium]
MQDKLKDIFKKCAKEAAVYVHVPFCARACAYCKFYKAPPSAANFDFYLENLELEAQKFFERARGLEISSVFFGGGTPTLLDEPRLARLAKIFRPRAKNVEWTIEASPQTINPRKLKLLKDLGINRLSLGVQSFFESTLKNLGRPHPLSASLRAIDSALAAFENVNIDLIFGAPNQRLAEWEADLIKAVSYPLKHISAYCLEFESATSACAGNAKPIELQEKEVDFLNLARKILPENGFSHYEISNYAKSGFACKHNLNTWDMNSWIGFGPSAASQFGGLRFKNASDLEIWARGVQSGEPAAEDIVVLDDEEMFSCALAFGLRKIGGVNLKEIKERFKNADFAKRESKIEELLNMNLLEKRGDFLKISPESIPLADSIAVELI